jgi:hypothetical protein
MPNSFFRRSAFNGPTPFRYSIGFSNMEGEEVMLLLFAAKIIGINSLSRGDYVVTDMRSLDFSIRVPA